MKLFTTIGIYDVYYTNNGLGFEVYDNQRFVRRASTIPEAMSVINADMKAQMEMQFAC